MMGEYDAGYENYIDGLNREIIDYQIEVEQMKVENAKLRELCEWLLTPYRLGAVTGEGVDRQWCRETYDGGSYRLRELGVDA